MKDIFLRKRNLILAFILSVLVFQTNVTDVFAGPHGKHSNSQCNSAYTRIDSIFEYSWNSETSEWNPSTIRDYSYDDKSLLGQIIYLEFQTRQNKSRLSFNYNEEELFESHEYDLWTNEQWTPSQFVTYSYDENNYRTGVTYYSFQENIPTAFQKALYSNDDEGNIITATNQLLDENGSWYDFSIYYYMYKHTGSLDFRYRVELKNHDTIYQEKYHYDRENRLVRQDRKQMRYNRVTERYDIPVISVNFYYYNSFDLVRKIITKSEVDGVLINKSKQVYFYPYLKLKKVPVCHNGHTIYVSKNALRAHFAHGDCIGICDPDSKWKHKDDDGDHGNDGIDDDDDGDEDEGDEDDKDWGNNNSKSQKDFDKFKNNSSCKVYPNPFNNRATISFMDKKVSRVELLNMSGNKLRSYNVKNMSELIIERGSLRKGIYLLRIHSDKIENIKVVVN